ncbi:cytochrome P450 CYP72A219-like [Diospyros lotus]|uniref:cytochrome P450 CYP72A219-like n=1 Tax=Diospyros lotus TaxID=55363 RepID=UPI002250C128|nr:cytochrome P450 CYP72A219-like [Diospyros lotus]
MDNLEGCVALSLAAVFLVLAWTVFNWLWLRPKRLERHLRTQGFSGNSYRLLFGDIKENAAMMKEARSRPINLSDDITPRVTPFINHYVKNWGKRSFTWTGPTPMVNIMEPQLIKEILLKHVIFPKQKQNPLARLLISGLVSLEGQKWVKHRKIIRPAFSLDKLKHMLQAFDLCCGETISKWEKMVSSPSSMGWCEIDVWPDLEALTADAISRTAFGSNYEEGRRVFQLQKEQAVLAAESMRSIYIPGWRLLPTKNNKRMKAICREVEALLLDIINRRVKAMDAGDSCGNDLLGILLESNLKEIQEQGNDRKLGMSIEEVIEECKLFYFAGQETTSALLGWTLVLLSRHQDWQQRAREELFQLLGSDVMPSFDALTHLRVVHMILLEVLRLYPPIVALVRSVPEDVSVGGLLLPAGVKLFLPAILIHRDNEIWGDDANEFKPERFENGASQATNGQVAYFPFGWGPRICIGQNFALLEAKMAMAMILRRFWFELSPSYVHAPATVITLQPQYGAQLVLHKL